MKNYSQKARKVKTEFREKYCEAVKNHGFNLAIGISNNGLEGRLQLMIDPKELPIDTIKKNVRKILPDTYKEVPVNYCFWEYKEAKK